jgi:3-oxoacyl-[acyl-carrier protein] reductase
VTACAGRLDGRVALVTGGGGGIGRAVAERLGAEGASVVVNDLVPEAAARAVQELAALGVPAVSAPGSVSDPEEAARIVAVAADTFGALDILVNNAGVIRDAPIHRMDDQDWRLVQDVILYGAFAMSRAAAALLRGSRAAPPSHHRKVVNMSSNVGLYGAPGTANYAAAKAGLIGLTKSLAREWAKSRVNVNAIAPGFVTGTGLADTKSAELLAHVIAQQPFGRAATPEDCAAAVAYLASPDADYVTGQVLELSGGLEIQT